MKKLFINVIIVAMFTLIIAPGVSAQSSNLSSDSDSFKDHLSKKVLDEVEPYVVQENNSFKLKNKTQVQNKLSKNEFEAVEKQISKINASMKDQDNLKKVSGENAFSVEYTNEEVAKILKESGYKLDKSEQQLLAKEGKTKVNYHYWGVEVWLSRSVTSTIAEAGVNGAAALGGIISGGIAFPLLQTAAGFIAGKVVADKAKPVYFKLGAIQGLHDFKYQ